MPNKTFYITEADLPLLNHAQEIAGNNLSVTVTKALQQYVTTHTLEEEGYKDIRVKIGNKSPYKLIQFKGKLLVSRGEPEKNGIFWQEVSVYQTAKGKFAVRRKNIVDWFNLSNHEENWSNWSWSKYYNNRKLCLNIYDSLKELKKHISLDIYEAVEEKIIGENIEVLDI